MAQLVPLIDLTGRVQRVLGVGIGFSYLWAGHKSILCAHEPLNFEFWIPAHTCICGENHTVSHIVRELAWNRGTFFARNQSLISCLFMCSICIGATQSVISCTFALQRPNFLFAQPQSSQQRFTQRCLQRRM